MYDWVDAYLRGTNGLYGDHVDLAGVVEPGQLTYNQGTMIGGSVLLYRVTQDPAYLVRARAIADTSLDVFGADFSQQPVYNAVFFRNLLLLEAETGDERYRAAMQAYADHVWDDLRDASSGLFNFAYGRNRTLEPHRLVDQAAMLQIYALLALGLSAADNVT
jgi:rhamnogalacturonyl hydrolase YesR